MSTPAADGFEALIDELLACCPMIRSLWLVADCAGEGAHAARLYTWDLIAFADPLSLHRLRRSVKLHRADVRVRVLGEGNRLESAWGGEARHGVLCASDWRESNPGEGTYLESSPPLHGIAGLDKRVRRKALCVWQGIDALKGPGS